MFEQRLNLFISCGIMPKCTRMSKTRKKFRRALVGVLLVVTSLGCIALTLGRARGAAWIGHGLDLVVPVQGETGVSSESLCPEADVFYGDSKQDGSRVRVLLEPTAQADTFDVRITSTTTIDEPVVTVYLRTGCEQKIARRFVLLADYPNEIAPAAPRATTEPLVLTPPLAPTTAVIAPAAEPSTPPVASTTTQPSAQATPKPVSKSQPKGAPVAALPSPKATSPKGARLKLDPLENLAERIKTLESTAPVKVPEDVVQDSQRIQQLQGDIKALLGQASKNEASLLAMRERLEKAEAGQAPMVVVFGLMALVLLSLAGVAVLWFRRGERSAWQVGLPMAPTPTQAQRTSTEGAVQFGAGARAPEPDSEVDVNLLDMDEESFGALMGRPVVQPQELPPAAAAPVQAARMASDATHLDFNSESMFDLIQRADFYSKLDKTNQSIESLEKRIRSDGKSSPLLYLELLRIANTHSLKTDFRQFSQEFEVLFNAHVPEFALFRDEGRSLEAYPGLLKHIVEIWHSPKVLEVIESCVLRDPWEKNADPFDLAAFRELILLHGIAYSEHSRATGSQSSQLQHVDLDL